MRTKTKLASDQTIERLKSVLCEASRGLPGVTDRKMFGCHALFANNNIYALVWKTGRIGLRLPDVELFNELMSKGGSEPWTAGNRTMAHWVLVPKIFERKADLLSRWANAAHHLAAKAPRVPAKKK